MLRRSAEEYGKIRSMSVRLGKMAKLFVKLEKCPFGPKRDENILVGTFL